MMAPRSHTYEHVRVPKWLVRRRREAPEPEPLTKATAEAMNDWYTSYAAEMVERGPLAAVAAWTRRRRGRVSCRVRLGVVFVHVPADGRAARVLTAATLAASLAAPATHPLVAQSVTVVWRGYAHSTVLLLSPRTRDAIYYDPHGMYSDTCADYGPVSAALSAALRPHGWRMRHLALPAGGAGMQRGLPMCTFYTAFAVLLVACNAPEVARDVLRMLHDGALRHVLAQWFTRFVDYLAWVAVRRRVRAGGLALVCLGRDAAERVPVTGLDAGGMRVVYQDAYGRVHRACALRARAI